MKIATFDLEKKLLSEKAILIVGVDEAGRGPLAGPVVAAAAHLKSSSFPENELEKEWALVRDSKTLSATQRKKAFDFVKNNFVFGLGICDHVTIDRINILEATFLAMKKAIAELDKKLPKGNSEIIFLIDGKMPIPNFSRSQKAIIGGDSLVKSIAAASILAKVTRDEIMEEFHKKYPQYNFVSHKGYGTKAHFEALRKFGMLPIHRRSFLKKFQKSS